MSGRNFILSVLSLVVLGSILWGIFTAKSITKVYFENTEEVIISDALANLIWFSHLTDLHLSKFETNRQEDLSEFGKTTLPILSPCFVLVTGDLVDSKQYPRNHPHSGQWFEEWTAYSATMKNLSSSVGADSRSKKFLILWKSFSEEDVPRILDMRGNHDAFDTPLHKPDDFKTFRRFQPSDPNDYSYVYHLKTDFGVYRFISVDACPKPGLHRPYNFFGMIDRPTLDFVQNELQKSTFNVTMVASHYPLSTVSSGLSSDRWTYSDLLRKYPVFAHLSGHLHTLGGLSDESYTKRDEGHYDLELGDFKVNRKWRLMVTDHDLTSFVDVSEWKNHWPLILVSNPKDARFLSETEPLGRMLSSTHIRILIFSPHVVNEVTVRIDGGDAVAARRVDPLHPLYVVPWTPRSLSSGLHTLVVVAADAKASRTVTQQFSVDGSCAPLGSVGSFFLSGSTTKWFRVTFYLLHFVFVGLCLLGSAAITSSRGMVRGQSYLMWRDTIMRRLAADDARDTIQKTHQTVFQTLFYSPWRWMISRFEEILWCLCELVSNRVTFVTLLVAGIWFLLGPLLIGEFVSGSIGVAFSWGFYIDGSWMLSADSFQFVLPRFLFGYCPLVLFAALAELRTHPIAVEAGSCQHITSRSAFVLFWMVFVFFLFIAGTVDMVLSYGTSALLSPGVSGLGVLYLFILYRGIWH